LAQEICGSDWEFHAHSRTGRSMEDEAHDPGSIDALCDMFGDFDEGPVGQPADAFPGEDPASVSFQEEVAAAAELEKQWPAPFELEPRAGALSSASQAGSDVARVAAPPKEQEPDLPEPTLALPPEVVPVPFVISAHFDLRVQVDVKQVAFSLRHAEFNPRKHGNVTLRLFNPRTCALVRPSGKVSMVGAVTEEQMKSNSKKIARLVQRCGHEEARFVDYRVTSIYAKATLNFPVRLEALAARWRRNALYEPEIYCGCVFKTLRPKWTFLVTAGGKVMISGCTTMEQIKEALRRAYPVFHEFQR